VLLGELFRRLGLGTWKEYSVDLDEVDDEFRRAAVAALAMPPERVREAAARTYEDVFGRPVPAFTRTPLP
jgi:hypothetical protein